MIACYGDDFYKGMPAVTKHQYGKGICYYIATRTEDDFLQEFYHSLVKTLGIATPPVKEMKKGISITRRCSEDKEYLFFMNYSESVQKIELEDYVMGALPVSLISGKQAEQTLHFEKYGYDIIEIQKKL